MGGLGWLARAPVGQHQEDLVAGVGQKVSSADQKVSSAELPPEAAAAIPLQQDGGGGEGKSESTLTVAVAFVANLVIAIAKTGAALLTGSASMVAEAAHSWAKKVKNE